MIQSMLSIAVVIGVALLAGFRPAAGPLAWIAAIGVLAMITFALTWLSVALGLVSQSIETASNLPMFLVLLPFLGSGFAPTHSMPAGVRWFAENQPFTPVIETFRGLLLGSPIGSNAVIAAAWCAGIALLSPLVKEAVQPQGLAAQVSLPARQRGDSQSQRLRIPAIMAQRGPGQVTAVLPRRPWPGTRAAGPAARC